MQGVNNLNKLISSGPSKKMTDNLSMAVKNLLKVEIDMYNDQLEKGCQQLEDNEFKEAIFFFDQIISMLEDSNKEHLKDILAEAYTQKGIALSTGGIEDNIHAYECIKKALQLNPKHEKANLKMMAMKYDRGEVEENNDMQGLL